MIKFGGLFMLRVKREVAMHHPENNVLIFTNTTYSNKWKKLGFVEIKNVFRIKSKKSA